MIASEAPAFFISSSLLCASVCFVLQGTADVRTFYSIAMTSEGMKSFISYYLHMHLSLPKMSLWYFARELIPHLLQLGTKRSHCGCSLFRGFRCAHEASFAPARSQKPTAHRRSTLQQTRRPIQCIAKQILVRKVLSFPFSGVWGESPRHQR